MTSREVLEEIILKCRDCYADGGERDDYGIRFQALAQMRQAALALRELELDRINGISHGVGIQLLPTVNETQALVQVE